MSRTIALAGKGGTGKTTIAALLARLLSQQGTVLAIDADPAVNLHMALGVPLEATVGEVREEMLAAVRGGSFGLGISKHDYLELKIAEALVEGEGIDLLAMGRPEGPGCYCAANSILRACIDRLAGSYDYVVIDNEAGMEHISRQTTRDVDILVLVSDPSVRGLTTASRMKELVGELRSQVGRIGLVVNRANGELSPEAQALIGQHSLELLATIPVDTEVERLDARGLPIVELPREGPVYAAVAGLARTLKLL